MSSQVENEEFSLESMERSDDNEELATDFGPRILFPEIFESDSWSWE